MIKNFLKLLFVYYFYDIPFLHFCKREMRISSASWASLIFSDRNRLCFLTIFAISNTSIEIIVTNVDQITLKSNFFQSIKGFIPLLHSSVADVYRIKNNTGVREILLW